MSIPIPLDIPFKYFSTFWLTSREFWQARWDGILDTVGEDPFHLHVNMTLMLVFVTYWTVGGMYLIFDITNKPEFIRRYKIQRGTNEPVDPVKLRKVILAVLVNQLLAYPAGVIGYKLLRETPGGEDVRTLPSFHNIIFWFIVFILIEECGFYYSHRLLHTKYFYKRIHKKHHEWTSPISITAMYCHPIENIFGNILPLAIGPFVFKTHVFITWIWFIKNIINTINDHSGYNFPFFSNSESHDFHHLKFNNCYGVNGLLDRIHGTDNLFRQTEAFKRHYRLINLIPPRASPNNNQRKLE